jgi:hypothetical protein
MGQKQTFAVQKGMSALPSKADILCVERNLVTMIFPTRFPTELLTTGWEMAGLDGGD